MPSVDRAPLSGRYLSFAEREEIAILKAQGVGVRETAQAAGTVAVDDLAGVAPQRGDAVRPARVPGLGGAVEGRAGGPAPKTAKLVANERLREYVQQRLVGRGSPARTARR